jgi:prepilin-type N-terminal cleavage/methylation domain-containing protein
VTPDSGTHIRGKGAGFTLIEVVAAVVLLGIAVPPILAFLAQSGVKGVFPERQTAAYFLAVEKLETIIADRHSPNRGYAYLTTANYPAETLSDGYTRTVAFQEVAPTSLASAQSGSGYLRITVTVSYANPTGSYRISYVVCNIT